MKKEFSIAYTREIEGLLIEALAPIENGGGFRAISFRAGRIDYLCQINDRASAIVLQSGVAVPVALSYAELKKTVYEADMSTGGSIDLTLVTGQAAKDAVMPKLSRRFNEGAAGQNPLQIRALLRKRQDVATTEWVFSVDRMKSFGRAETTRSRCGECVVLRFDVGGPFGDFEAVIDMPYDDFVSMVNTARQTGQGTLDMYDSFVKNPKRYGLKI